MRSIYTFVSINDFTSSTFNISWFIVHKFKELSQENYFSRSPSF